VRLAFATDSRRAAEIDAECRIVAFEPHAQVTLERSGREFSRPEDYVDPAELERLGLENFALVEALCHLLDELCEQHISAVRSRGLRPATWHFMELKPLYDRLSQRAFELRRILEHERPEEAVWFADEHDGRLLDVLVPELGISARRLDVSPQVSTEPQGVALRSTAVRTIRRFRRRFRTRGDVRVLCALSGYSVPSIARELRRLGHEAVDWPALRQAPAAPDLGALHAAVEQDEAVRRAFVWEELDYWAAGWPRLRRLLDEAVTEALRADAEAVAVFAATRPHVLLTPVAAMLREKTICAAAAAAGIPVLVSRHGELGMRAAPMVAHQDVESVDWSLCWGRWEQEWTKRYARRHVETVVVGAPMIEEAVAHAPARSRIRRRLGVREDERVVLYLPTNLSHRDWYSGRRMPPDSVYFRQQQDAVRALAGLAGLRLVVKEHPAYRPTPLARWCDGLSEVEVIYEPTFASLINFADLVVLDAPSTSLVQALFGDAPIYVLDNPVFAWEPGVVDHLRAHGVAFSTHATLADDIGAAAARGPYSQEARDPLAFGGDGLSARRAAQAIVAISNGDTPDWNPAVSGQ
jgi:hypothetical protein